MSMTYEQFLALFPHSPREKAGKGVRVLCPAHNDRNPSLWVEPPQATVSPLTLSALQVVSVRQS